VPVGDVLVGDTGGNIEHDDTALAVDVVTITETTELLLTSGIPDIELDSTVVLYGSGLADEIKRRNGCGAFRRGTYGVKVERVHLDTKGGNVLLLEFTSQVTLDESGLRLTALVIEVVVRRGWAGIRIYH
jgi:hypothetical protein